jgi:hypothetical protein
MGTRINALFDHNLNCYNAAETTLSRLAAALPAALAVANYWQLVEPHSQHSELAVWRGEQLLPLYPHHRRYSGPGSIFIQLTAGTCWLRTAAGGAASSASSHYVACIYPRSGKWPPRSAQTASRSTEIRAR